MKVQDNEQNKKNPNRKVNEALQEESITFSVTVDRPGLWHKLGLKKKKRTFTIDPPPLKVLSLISEHVSNIEVDDTKIEELEKKGSLLDVVNEVLPRVGQNYDYAIKTIVTAVTHQRENKKIENFIGHNMRAKEFHHIVSLILERMELSFFLIGLAFLKGINLYEEKQAESTHSRSSAEPSEPDTVETK
ncbi:MAG: hypothetical protein ACOC4Y_00415 [bacterium]